MHGAGLTRFFSAVCDGSSSWFFYLLIPLAIRFGYISPHRVFSQPAILLSFCCEVSVGGVGCMAYRNLCFSENSPFADWQKTGKSGCRARIPHVISRLRDFPRNSPAFWITRGIPGQLDTEADFPGNSPVKLSPRIPGIPDGD